jgi:gamma-carbonic anhydrase
MLHSYKGINPKFGVNCFFENSAQIIGDVEFGDDCSVWFNAVIRGDVNYIRIGDRTNIQDGAILHVTHKTCPLILKNDITVGHGAILHGATIEAYCLIGMGAKILDNCVIEPYSIVAAGSVLTPGTIVPTGHMVAGVPAKVIRKITDKEREFLKQSAQNYIEYKKDYM